MRDTTPPDLGRASLPADPAGPVLARPSLDHFHRIQDPSVELVLWTRQLPDALAGWLEALDSELLPNLRAVIGVDDLAAEIESLLASSPMPIGKPRAAFAADVNQLSRLFAETMALDAVDIRIEPIRHDACWKFHRDRVPARLVTTYRGPGTEWVDPGDGDRAVAQQKSFQGALRRFPPHAVGLFKGSCAEPARGIVHRSPPIAGTGLVRLLLCIDAAPDPLNT